MGLGVRFGLRVSGFGLFRVEHVTKRETRNAKPETSREIRDLSTVSLFPIRQDDGGAEAAYVYLAGGALAIGGLA